MAKSLTRFGSYLRRPGPIGARDDYFQIYYKRQADPTSAYAQSSLVPQGPQPAAGTGMATPAQGTHLPVGFVTAR